MKSGLYEINGQDAYDTYGVVLDYDSLGELMAPPPLKTAIKNDAPGENGTQYSPVMPKVKERSVTLIFHQMGSSAAEAQAKYDAFVTMLLAAPFTLKVLRTGTSYHLRYKSSTGFVPWYYDRAKYTLSVIEPNPLDHSE